MMTTYIWHYEPSNGKSNKAHNYNSIKNELDHQKLGENN